MSLLQPRGPLILFPCCSPSCEFRPPPRLVAALLMPRFSASGFPTCSALWGPPPLERLLTAPFPVTVLSQHVASASSSFLLSQLIRGRFFLCGLEDRGLPGTSCLAHHSTSQPAHARCAVVLPTDPGAS